MFSQVPTPQPNESCEDFCLRAHKSLMTGVPNAGDRNQMVWNAWDLSHGSVERYRAQQKFGGYRMVPNVCHFAEHTTTTRGGQMVVDSVGVKEICQNMNRRIGDVGLYPPLINKHTADVEQAGQEPYIVGYGGNYRIGMIGEGEKQRYAIFGDEFHKPEHTSELNGKPRRSVELIRYKDSSRNFFDPIACLGAESPRIEIPPAYYSIEHDEEGLEVVRYSIASPVYAGSSNTFIPTFGEDKERRSVASGEPNTEKYSMLQQEDLTQVIDAIKNALSPYLQYLDTQMQGQMGGDDQVDALAMAGNQGQPGQSGQPPAAPAPAPAPAPVPTPKPEQFSNQPMPAMRYEAGADDDAEVERYSALQDQFSELVAECGQLRTRLGQLETERTDAIRAHRLHQLCSEYEGAIDFDEESSKVLYSAGAELDDDEFEERLELIERYAAKATPPKEMIPDGELEDDSAEKPLSIERYSARVQTEVVRRMTDEISNGKQPRSYNTVEAEVCKEFGIE